MIMWKLMESKAEWQYFQRILQTQYQEALELLIYLTTGTRPDLECSVSN